MYKYVFGPVPSRRLGVSLGIDLVEAKTCNLNCIYCECGGNARTYSERCDYVDIEVVKKELLKALEDVSPDYITFSGSGEPTLNKSIGKLIHWVKENTPHKVAVITNSTTLNMDGVIEELKMADVIMPSLDAVSEENFLQMNRPHPTLKATDILEGLKKLSREYSGRIYLEVFITAGLNDTQEELEKFGDYLRELKVDGVQLNTLARPGAVGWIKPATFERLEEIRSYLEDRGIEGVEVIKKYKRRSQLAGYSRENESLILNMLSKRPYTLEELEGVVGKDLHKYLEILEAENKVKSVYRDEDFYVEKL